MVPPCLSDKHQITQVSSIGLTRLWLLNSPGNLPSGSGRVQSFRRAARAMLVFTFLPALWQLIYYSHFYYSLEFSRNEFQYSVVDPEGFEPSAFSMPLRRAPNCAMGPYDVCRNRFIKKRTVFYFRISFPSSVPLLPSTDRVDLEGFEPSASSVRLKRAPNCATGPLSRFMILL